MNNITTLHQPNYLPWIGLFSKLALTQQFVIMDTLQYSRHGVIHRNKIRTNTGSKYLTIPISKQFATAIIRVIELPEDNTWKYVHWQSIYTNYVKTTYFKDYMDFFEDIYRKDFRFLWEINVEIIRYLIQCFKIDVEIMLASELDIPKSPSSQTATETIITTCKHIGATTYLSGPSGRNYLEFDKFLESGLTCRFHNFKHPVYFQRYPEFEPNLSAIDLLFNMGTQSSVLIKESGKIED